MSYYLKIIGLLTGLSLASMASAGKLILVIDDFGYRPQQENLILQMPAPISIAVLPNAPHAHEMAVKAHQRGHEVLIHLPMAPLSKQPLEKDTLLPDMPQSEIDRIVQQAIENVPYAVGLNNHMGSKMTSSVTGMRKVMQTLNHYNLYFLDSMTTGNSQSVTAAAGTRVKILKRRVFLDNNQDAAEIRKQFNQAVLLAKRDGSAIAIGHPHPTTVSVLQQMLPDLPADVTLGRPSELLGVPLPATTLPVKNHTVQPDKPFHGIGICPRKQTTPPAPTTSILRLMIDSIQESHIVTQLKKWLAPSPSKKQP